MATCLLVALCVSRAEAAVVNEEAWTNLAANTDTTKTISATHTVTASAGTRRLFLASMVTRFADDTTITVTFTTSGFDPQGKKLLAATYSGVDQITPITDSAANTVDTSGPIQFGAQIDYLVGAELVYIANYNGSNTNSTDPSGYSLIYTNEFSGSITTSIGHKDDTTTDGSAPATTGVDFGGGASIRMLAVAALKPYKKRRIFIVD